MIPDACRILLFIPYNSMHRIPSSVPLSSRENPRPNETIRQPGASYKLTMKKKTSTALFTAQLLTGLVAAAAAYALKPRPAKRNQVVVITGASRGLGLALAERFGRAGAKLVLASRDLDELIRARNLLVERQAVQSPDDVLLIPVDLTDHTQAINLIDHALGHFGRIDVLINNAGIIEVGPVQNQ